MPYLAKKIKSPLMSIHDSNRGDHSYASSWEDLRRIVFSFSLRFSELFLLPWNPNLFHERGFGACRRPSDRNEALRKKGSNRGRGTDHRNHAESTRSHLPETALARPGPTRMRVRAVAVVSPYRSPMSPTASSSSAQPVLPQSAQPELAQSAQPVLPPLEALRWQLQPPALLAPA